MKKTALITGATSGIGKAYAMQLAKSGYDLIITGRRQAQIEDVARSIQKAYHVRVKVYLVDFECSKQYNAFIEQIKKERIDVLINNAGYGAKKTFTEDTYTNQQAMIDVHVKTSVALCHSVAQQMKLRRSGWIINVSSLAGYLLLPKSAMYCATKAFLTSFTQSLAMELMPYNIRVQVLCPGFVHTDFHAKLAIEEKKCQSIGPVRWMSAEAVVATSLKGIEEGVVVCIPGKWNQAAYHLLKAVPKKLYYKVVTVTHKA